MMTNDLKSVETMVIGIDHGYGFMKTANESFTTAIKRISTEPALPDDVLEIENRYYTIGGERINVKEDKVHDENYYLLTLAAVAKRLSKMKIKTAKVILAVGLPLTLFGKEKNDFVRYLLKDKEVIFKFSGITYHIIIERVFVYPQCYAAVADKLKYFDNKVLVIDIGSWTLDLMPIVNHKPDESLCVTKPAGIITCIQQINKECVRQLNAEVDEYDIQKVMMKGGDHLPEHYRNIIEKEIRDYCQMIINYIRELGYNMDLTQIVFVGGGASVMRRFGGLSNANITYIEDVCANAKGYEMLANSYLLSMSAKDTR